MQAASLDFIEHKTNCVFVGPSGVGKTHLSNALGQLGCIKGYSVRFTLAATQRIGMRATVVGATGRDPDMVLYRDGEIDRSESSTPNVEEFDVLLQPGSYVLEVYDFNAIDPEPPVTDGNTCMDVFVFGTV